MTAADDRQNPNRPDLLRATSRLVAPVMIRPNLRIHLAAFSDLVESGVHIDSLYVGQLEIIDLLLMVTADGRVMDHSLMHQLRDDVAAERANTRNLITAAEIAEGIE